MRGWSNAYVVYVERIAAAWARIGPELIVRLAAMKRYLFQAGQQLVKP